MLIFLCCGWQVKFSVEVPTSISQECYQTTLMEYSKRFKVPPYPLSHFCAGRPAPIDGILMGA